MQTAFQTLNLNENIITALSQEFETGCYSSLI